MTRNIAIASTSPHTYRLPVTPGGLLPRLDLDPTDLLPVPVRRVHEPVRRSRCPSMSMPLVSLLSPLSSPSFLPPSLFLSAHPSAPGTSSCAPLRAQCTRCWSRPSSRRCSPPSRSGGRSPSSQTPSAAARRSPRRGRRGPESTSVAVWVRARCGRRAHAHFSGSHMKWTPKVARPRRSLATGNARPRAARYDCK